MASLEKCPHCERDFNSITDYPAILLKGVQRFEVPSRLVYRGGSSTLFIDKEGREQGIGNQLVPEPVYQLFQSTQADRVDFEGFEWSRDYSLRGFTYNAARIEELGDRREKLTESLNPYFNKLEDAVGTEVPTKLLIPPAVKILPRGTSLELCDEYGTDGQKDLSKASLMITYVSGHISLMTMHSSLSKLAIFDYEGRIKTY